MSGPPRFRGSAAVVLVRGHGRELETFWVRRSEAVSFMPEFDAFIGGSTEPADFELPLAGAADDAGRMLRACAIREAFEEAGVLVALDPAGAPAADPATLAGARAELLAGGASFAALAARHGWRFRADALAAAGRWQTPPFATTRFDTQYFLARVPDGQQASVHAGELASGDWITPAEAIARWKHGDATFAAPILHTLLGIAAGEDGLAARLEAAPERSRAPVRRIELQWGVVLHPMRTKPLPPATHTNCYVVGERDAALIDPGGADPEDLEELFTLLDALAREQRRVTMVLVTHHHPDHVAGLEAVRAHTSAPVAAHADTARHVRADVVLKDGDVVPLAPGPAGEWSLRALHTPGHARGHMCFLLPRTGALFTGDHIPGGRGTVIIDPPEGDMHAYLASLGRLLEEPVRTLFPGHGSPQGAPQRRIRGLIAHRLERKAKVLAALGATPEAPDALVPRAYDDTPESLWPYAERSLLAHLIELEAEGHAAREGERWRRA